MHHFMPTTADCFLSPLAHAGHGPIDASHPAHYLASPEHALGVLAMVALIAWAVWFAGRWAYRISNPT